MEIAVRLAKKLKSAKAIREAISLVDRVTKKKLIHKNKAAHLKSKLSKLLMKKTTKSDFKSKKK